MALRRIVLLIFATQCLWIESQVTKQSGTNEYCQWETFNATCRPNEVIMMEYAYYGRMRIGRCVPYEYILGCATDVLDQLAGRCSGRESCSVNVPDSELFKVHPCRKDLVAYLEASYRCVAVFGIPDTNSRSSLGPCSTAIPITQSSGYLAGSVTHRTGLGSGRCPWVLKVLPGQRINVTLYDFSNNNNINKDGVTSRPPGPGGPPVAASVASAGNDADCLQLAVFRDGSGVNEKRQTRLCSRSAEARKSVYTSRTNRLSIALPNYGNHSGQQLANTVIYFEPVGCPDPEVSSNAILTRKEETLAIFCNATGEKWHLVCKDNHWIGSFSNCSKGVSAPVLEDPAVKINKGGFPFGLLVAIAVGVIAGVFLGFLLLVLIFSCRKRFFHRRPEQSVLLIDYENPQKVYKQLDLMKTPLPLQQGCECVLAEFRTAAAAASDSTDPAADPMIVHTPIPPPEVYFSAEEIYRKTLNKRPPAAVYASCPPAAGRHGSSTGDCTCGGGGGGGEVYHRNKGGALCCDTWSPGVYLPEDYSSVGSCSPMKTSTTARLL